MKKIRLTYNAPVTLTFVLLCFSATLLNYMTQGSSNALLFMTYHSSLTNRVFDTCSTLNSLQAAEMRCFFVKFYHFICCTGLYFI